VIIPVLNDTEALDSLLWQLREISAETEIVVADGGKSGDVEKVCGKYGALWIASPRGRARQMNLGAARSAGSILWFLHADAILHPESLEVIRNGMAEPGTVGGAFRFQLHQRHWYATWLDFGVNLRSDRLKLPYGDQGYFVRRPVFESMGGYRDIPFLEDVEFIRRLPRHGNVEIVPVPIGVSSRRWEREGFFYTTIRNWLVTIAYFRGVSPERLMKFYSIENDDERGRDRNILRALAGRLWGFLTFGRVAEDEPMHRMAKESEGREGREL